MSKIKKKCPVLFFHKNILYKSITANLDTDASRGTLGPPYLIWEVYPDARA